MSAIETTARSLGNNVDNLRRHNLSTLLGIVHRDGPASRSRLTKLTELNRSTIAALVGELVTLGLAREVQPEGSRTAGRPSPIVVANEKVVAFAVNPEINAITVGAVGLGGVVLDRVRMHTGNTPSVVEAVALATTEIKRMRSRLRKDVRVVGVGVALPGLVRREDGVVRLAPHLGWIDEPFSGRLSDAVGLPVSTANDASVGATAESRFGAGRGVRDLVYLNGGASGIGGGVIVEGRPLTGVTGYAGELGHTLVNSAGILCHCGATGCLETEVTQSRLLDVLGLDDPEMDELDHAIAVSESPEVRDEIDRQLTFLAVTLRNAVNIFNPRLIVLGGFLGALFEASPGTIERAIAEQTLAGPGDCVEVVRAQLRSRLLMIGAAELAFAALLADPASSAT